MLVVTILVLVGLPCLLGMAWLSLRAVATADPAVVPTCCRRRLVWCVRHPRAVYLWCAALPAIAVVAQLAHP